MSKIGIEPIITIFRIAACVFQRIFFTVVGNESQNKMVGGEVIETPSAAYKTAVINQYTNRP